MNSLSGTDERRFLARWLTLSLLLILVAAIRSEGFHHPDEQFQILEFAGAKLGRTPWSALPWEYGYRMRPWLQPGLYTLAARGLGAVGVEDPFTWALAFRLFSGVAAWFGIVGLALCSERWFSDGAERRLAVRVLVLLYFVPYLAVRTSSESLSTSCVVLALCFIVLRADGAGFALGLWVGALLGLACALRYPSAVVVASILAWSLVFGRVTARWLGWILLGMASALALALLVDRWGYGEWTLAAWNYAFHNFTEDRAALEFGTLPWYGYLFVLGRGPFAPLNLLLAGLAVVAWIRQPRHPLTWATAPLTLVQCAIAHKELRFLFPIAMLSPPLLVLAVGAPSPRGWRRALAAGLVVADLAGLAAGCLLPAQTQIVFQRFVGRRYPGGLQAYLTTQSPWVRHGLTMFFYASPPVGLRTWPGTPALAAAGVREMRLVASSWDGIPAKDPYVCEAVYRSVPGWISRLGWPRRVSAPPPAWDIYRCTASGETTSPQPTPGRPGGRG